MERRNFLALTGTAALLRSHGALGLPNAPDNPKADIEIHIAPVEIEVPPRKIIQTAG
jgi:hypothetical protein